MKRYPKFLIYSLLLVYLCIESSFLIANLSKFPHGGWVTLLIASAIISVMFIWYKARKILNTFTEFVSLTQNLPLIEELSNDPSIEKYATHLVYLTSANNPNEIEEKIIYSLLKKRPKKADIYWFIHIDVTDEPHTQEYVVTHLLPHKIIRVDLRLGFRQATSVNKYFREIVTALSVSGEVDIISRYTSLHKHNIAGDFRFVVMKKYLALENELTLFQKLIMNGYFLLKRFSLSEEKGFGLESGNVKVEQVPIIIVPPKDLPLKRIV